MASKAGEKSPVASAEGLKAKFAPSKRIGAELEHRMGEVARREGAPSFWNWLKTQTGQAFSEEAQAFTVGTIAGWLISHGAKPSRNSQAKVRAEELKERAAYYTYLAQLAGTLANEVETRTLADDTYFLASGMDNLPWNPERASVHLVPRLRAYAERCLLALRLPPPGTVASAAMKSLL